MRNTGETSTVVNRQMRSTTARDSTTKYFCGDEVFPSEQTEARQDLISVESRNVCVEEEDRKVLSVNKDESSKNNQTHIHVDLMSFRPLWMTR
jgi:hypothetical protein